MTQRRNSRVFVAMSPTCLPAPPPSSLAPSFPTAPRPCPPPLPSSRTPALLLTSGRHLAHSPQNGKCIAQAACATAQLATATATSFNCFTREMWSAEKTAWCCEHRDLGCPTPTAAATLGANGHGQYHGADGASVPSPADEGGNTEQPPVLGASRESAPESIVADQDVPPENGSQAALAAGTSAAAISPAANALCIVIAIVAAGSVVALCKRRCSGPATRTRLADEKASPSKSHEMNAPSAISTASNIA